MIVYTGTTTYVLPDVETEEERTLLLEVAASTFIPERKPYTRG